MANTHAFTLSDSHIFPLICAHVALHPHGVTNHTRNQTVTGQPVEVPQLPGHTAENLKAYLNLLKTFLNLLKAFLNLYATFAHCTDNTRKASIKSYQSMCFPERCITQQI